MNVQPLSKDQCALTIATEIPRLPGWCSHSKAQRLFELVCRERPVRSIELGVFGGRSMLPMALAHWHLNLGTVVGVDPWTNAAALEGTNSPENDKWWGEVQIENCRLLALGMLERVVPLPYWTISRRTSAEHASDPMNNPIKYGVLHQDSNHSEEISCAELAAYRPLVQPGALWIMDDVQWPTLQKVQRLMVDEYGFRLLEDHEDWRVYRVPA